MTPADIERVFGRGRLKMVTGDHVEVFREASLPGERRRYTKRFLATAAGDFRHWTEREWRILARLVGHEIGPVPDVVQFDRGAADRPALVQTYDAGITVDHWATLLPVHRDGTPLRHVFEDCAHWWALARHCLIALDTIHELQLVHLDLKADNVCIPFDPTDFDPRAAGQGLRPRFEQITLIDFAFSLVSGENLTRALPIARQHEYDYQSPRLLLALEAGSRGDLLPTSRLDWRCDVFSLAAMLRRYLPDPEAPFQGSWTQQRHAQARSLVRRLLDAHDAERPARRPHRELLALTTRALDDGELAASLASGWTLAIDSLASSEGWPTPVTRIAMPLGIELQADPAANPRLEQARQGRVRTGRVAAALAVASLAAIGAPQLYDRWWAARGRQVADAGPAMPVQPIAPLSKVEAGAMPEVAPAPPRRVAAQAGASPTRADGSAPASALAPAPAPASASALQAPPVPVTTPGRGAASAPRSPTALPKPHTATAATTAAGVRVGAAVRSDARAGARRDARPEERPVRRLPANALAAGSKREQAMAWLTMRGPAPRSAAQTGPGAGPANALAPTAPAPLPVVAQGQAAVQMTAVAPAAVPAPSAAPTPADFAAWARELIANDLPQVVQRTERRVLRVMDIAGQPETAWQDEQIRRAAGSVAEPASEPLQATELASDDARQLHEAAQTAFWRRGSAREAHALQLKAFGANPFDAVIVSSLAFLSLKQMPAQPELARQMVLYSIGLNDGRSAGGRTEDWTTLAIASALTGRERDARNAWFVSLALAPQPERQCRVAVNAYASHGERLRSSVEALLYRAYASGWVERSAFCQWPPHWMAGRNR